jgi:adenylate cyclase, class 2
MREIEILFRVNEPLAAVMQKLQHYKYEGTEHITDIYLTHPSMPRLAPQGHDLLESFRIRRKGKNFLTWKRNHMQDGRYLYADEEEVEVASFEATLHMLKSLGFQELVCIENKRATFMAENYEIVLDDVDGLGVLLEVEHKAPQDRPAQEVLHEMRQFLHKTGITLGEELHLGKPELMLQKQGR